ncbi:SWIM zinc finger family protein [Gorillibacterium sp. sgz5001074]|uniref:SWIM zinc finger family protein n=1 Tax=Gorillibacterium sp. sgz5001074 TaxID=3446695 RepID=UPI003F6659AE
MLKLKLPKNRIEFLASGAERRMKLPVLERGWEYFHRGLVDHVNLVQGYILQAHVRGKDTFLVSLDLETFEKSECTCAFEGYCKHMAAVIFYAYSAHGRPELLLMRLKQSILTRRRTSKASGGKASADKTPADPAASILPELPPKEWARLFEQRFHGYSLSNQHSVEQFQQAVWDTLGELAKDWPEPLRELYRLHLTLYILKKIDQFHTDNLSSYLSYYIENGCKIVSGQCWEKLRDHTAQDSAIRSAADAYPAHWKETLSLVGAGAAKARTGPVHWPDVYRYLWFKLFHGTGSEAAELAAKERRRLELLLDQPSGTPRTRDGLLLALTTFDVMEGRDAEAMKRLEELNTKQFADFYVLLERFAESGDWGRMLEWLRWLLPVLAKAKQEEFNAGCAFWVEAMKHQPSDDEWLRVMLSLLPRSYYYYTDYLMQTKRYRQWVDLQLAAGVTPANLYTAELKTVEADNPSLLLPLFHQSVERAVMEKNRDSYKLAIRHMKKLHSLYKQLGKPELWEDYLARLHVKYARLRAFREELAKGPWTL